MSELAAPLGVLAGLIAVADTIPYARDMLRGTTRPHRGSWLIWSLLAIIVCLSQQADGASWSLVRAGTQAILTLLIFLLAIRLGHGAVTTPELITIAVAIAGAAGWIIADQPLVATVCVVLADLIGAALMLPKTYHHPESETLATFALASLGGALATASISTLDLSLLLYPAYYCLINAATALLIYHRRRLLTGHGALPAMAVPVAA
jgi:hypothetical protein